MTDLERATEARVRSFVADLTALFARDAVAALQDTVARKASATAVRSAKVRAAADGKVAKKRANEKRTKKKW